MEFNTYHVGDAIDPAIVRIRQAGFHFAGTTADGSVKFTYGDDRVLVDDQSGDITYRVDGEIDVEKVLAGEYRE